MKYTRYILLIGGLLIIGLLIYRTNPENILTAMKQSNPLYILAGLGIYSLSFCNRALKWNILLKTVANKRISFYDFLPIYLFNGMISNFTPAKTGDAIGPILFKRYFRCSVGSGFSVILVDRIIELLFLFVGMLGAGIYYYHTVSMGSHIFTIGIYGLLFFLIVCCAFITIFLFRNIFHRVIAWAGGKIPFPLCKRAIGFLKRESDTFYEGLGKLRMSKVVFLLIPLTCFAWLFDMGMVYLMLSSVLNIDFIHACTAFVLATGISLASFIPLGFGSSELSLYYFLSLKGYESSLLIGGILVTRFIPLGLILLYGIMSFFILKRTASFGS